MRNTKTIIIAIALLVTVNQLSAQTIINNDTTINNRVYLRAGIDPATMLTIGYERKCDISFLKPDIVTYAELGSSIANFKNSEFKVGGIIPIFEKRNFKIIFNVNLSAGHLSAKNFDSKKFALADELAFGIYKQKWFFALTAEYETIFLNYIEHTNFYKETYYEDAVDGWYNGAGGMWQFGLEVGKTFKQRYDLHLEIKMPFTEKFNSYGGSPAHINLCLGYRF